MSINRTCQNCFQKENIRVNFGDDREAERDFHRQKWCDCGYDSPEEMMINQDMGFIDPNWIQIAKHFIENYHLRLNQGHIQTNEELVRFYLKLLKSSANNIRKSIEIVDKKDGEEYKFIYNGKTERKPKTAIFKSEFILKSSYPEPKNNVTKEIKTDRKFTVLTCVYLVIGIVLGFIMGKIL